MAKHAASVSTLTVRVTLKPNAHEAAVIGDGPALRVSVKSPPVDGRANAEAAALIARAFGVPKSRVMLTRGARSRTKQFAIVNPEKAPAGFRNE